MFIESQCLTHHVFILDPSPAVPDKIPAPRVEVDEPKFVKDTYPLLGEDQTDGPPNNGRLMECLFLARRFSLHFFHVGLSHF